MNKSILLLPALFLVFSSCKKDDPTPSTKSILGTWYSTVSVVTNCTDEESNGNFTFNCPNGDCISYTFVADTVVTMDGETEEKTVTQLYSSSRRENGNTINQSGTFTLGPNELTLCMDEEGEVFCETLELTLADDELSLVGTDSETGCKEVVSLEREASE